MEYIHRELELAEGEPVEILLEGWANVQLLDPENYESYKARKPYRYHGGFTSESPFRLSAPAAGKWHLVIDLGGGPGCVRAWMVEKNELATAAG